MTVAFTKPCSLCLPLDAASLGRVMPLYLWLTPDGTICSCGPTLRKLFGGRYPGGLRFDEVFSLQRPRGITSMQELGARSGEKLKLALRNPPHTGFKGMVMPLKCGQGVLLNLSFGINVAEAVRDHHLTDADFAPTDLTVEMLYLVEAKSAVVEELRSLNQRLQGAKSEAEEQALTDTLTGVRNRRAMDQALQGVAQSGGPFGLIHVDLDYFKQVNDTLGHAAGDHVLATVAAILAEETRKGDTVARVGGDEFVVVLPGISDPEELDGVARRILDRIEAPIAFGGRECRVSASIGITSSGFYGTPRPDRILSDADRALYASKRNGRSRITICEPAVLPSAIAAASKSSAAGADLDLQR